MQFPRSIARACALALTLATFGCGGGSSGSGPGFNSTPTPDSSLFQTKATGIGALTATLSQNTARVALDGTVIYTMKLTNPSGASSAQTVVSAVDSSGASVPPVTLVVLDPSGGVAAPTVPPKADPKIDPPLPPGVQVVTLQPGQSLSLTSRRLVYGQRGVYNATATFSVSTSALAAAKSVAVGPLPVTVY